MASLTVRQLADSVKTRLRLRAAQHGRSMEDEVRTILGRAADEAGFAATDRSNPASPPGAAAESTTAQPSREPARGTAVRVLLIIGGGIAAYKSLDLIRRLKERGIAVRVVMTAAAQEFVTPLSAGALSGEKVFTNLFDETSEFDIGHIRLAHETDVIVVAPATADLMAKMAGGHADDLASTVLLATDRKILLAPAMNPRMWQNPATRRNFAQLVADGVALIGPNAGEMAEAGEAGIGRVAEPLEIVAAVESLSGKTRSLAGKRVIVTSGPTHEPIDPVRYIANRSSGKQGHAIATAAALAGADVILISGPVSVPDPEGVKTIKVETAREMLQAVENALPADVAIFAAAVADWRVEAPKKRKIKKSGRGAPEFDLVENPDILSTIAHDKTRRPKLVIGFAAETEKVIENAKAKLTRKGCDWIVANDVSPASGVMGGDINTVHIVTRAKTESLPPQSKEDVAVALVSRIAAALKGAAR
ncbi:MAG TPA: bifunctional phosphopantothenoylcysteine decarboxylase/phosphopantothenate--cysteine ligase CoaBC [Xanthobacteraceae bacterium]|nr:bifunctional phosphopantothenoylcysteine decarboxylase/phosphopantothenate--cysteine ligase CoaBC [Xanthobacteraceae bacterium]